MHDLLDQYLARLQNLQSFNVYSVLANGSAEPWYEVTGAIVRDLVLDEATLAQQVQTIAAQITHWGRLAAQAKRVWEIEEREYRRWRDYQILKCLEVPKEAEARTVWKKPSEAVIEATYRTNPKYVDFNIRIERAEEAYNAAIAVQEGFKAKRDVLIRYVVRYKDETHAHLTV
jgi:hypothetical protein